ncbi:MAG TPA: hypothetical protein PKU94_07575 [Candidatus Hydrothermia bacterium]|nr:hypothetical protein [Candidatus Hydrothermia bacterium]
MIVNEMNEGRKAEYSLDGYILTVDGESYDLAALQQDTEVILDVIKNNQYIANIIIPPRKYRYVERQETDISGEPITVQVPEPEPLDINAVILNLWAIPEVKTNTEGGM